MRVARLAAGLLAGLICAAAPTEARAAEEQRLVASGCSVSNVGYLTELAADYQEKTGVTMFVRGGGSVIGLEDLATGASDFAASCRGPLPDDPADIEFVQVAWDALVFIVHPSVRVDSVTMAEAAEVFQGAVRDWGQLQGPAGPITVFLQRPTKGLTGVESSIRTQVLHGGKPAAGPNVSQLSSTAIVEQLVEKTPGSFAASGFSSARKRAVRMLRLGGVAPTREAIIDGTYPLRRPLYLIHRKPARAGVKAFVDFALSREGQELISSYGAISLRDLR